MIEYAATRKQTLIILNVALIEILNIKHFVIVKL